MKTILCLFAAAALLCGCQQKPDPKIAELERRVAALEVLCTNTLAYTDTTYVMGTNTLALAEILNDQVNELESNRPSETAPALDPNTGLPLPGTLTDVNFRLMTLESTVSNLIVSLNGKRSARPSYQAAPVATADGGIPASVLAQIKLDAAAEWPNDFDMQNYEIKKQTDAWYQLNH